MARDYRAAAGVVIEDMVAPRSVIQNKAVLFEKTDDVARSDSWQLGHVPLISSAKAIKPAMAVGHRKKWETPERGVFSWRHLI
jgi:hypothetical protein